MKGMEYFRAPDSCNVFGRPYTGTLKCLMARIAASLTFSLFCIMMYCRRGGVG